MRLTRVSRLSLLRTKDVPALQRDIHSARLSASSATGSLPFCDARIKQIYICFLRELVLTHLIWGALNCGAGERGLAARRDKRAVLAYQEGTAPGVVERGSGRD